MTVPIPARCAHRPTTGGLVQPWANVTLADGGTDFRSHHRARLEQCWIDRLCQVCGQRLTHPAVLFGGPNQLRELVFDEPPLHPECAVYTSHACPMVNGSRLYYADREPVSQGQRGKTCPDPGCDCDGWVQHPGGGGHGGGPAHEYYAVYVKSYLMVHRPNGDLLGGICQPGDVLGVRLVSRPGEGRCWVNVPDALTGYEAPDTTTVEVV